jgi:hypothetical protein
MTKRANETSKAAIMAGGVTAAVAFLLILFQICNNGARV